MLNNKGGARFGKGGVAVGGEFLLPYPPCLSITNYVLTGKARFYVKITDPFISIFPGSRSAILSGIRRRAIYGMMKTGLSFVLLPSCLVLLAACTPTPSDRIAENMPAYEQLPKEHQAKVARGELAKGMSPTAVLLAWGEPEQKMAGRMNGKNTERWIYTQNGTGWSVGLGGGGFRGWDSGTGAGIGVTMPLGSRPPVSCNVLFENGKVIGWEAVNGF